ncbi:hypothetical protein EVAR_40628_1 [Eumeta japonica]|uniref:Uncharacterized protein n=1 Tax=Eumeta variegata TaxID=151549 RepID=A0A4C1X2Y0_EUMVA|nr:hypothetical protein EVAR_40628_1 [Eumeta japonica]
MTIRIQRRCEHSESGTGPSRSSRDSRGETARPSGGRRGARISRGQRGLQAPDKRAPRAEPAPPRPERNGPYGMLQNTSTSRSLAHPMARNGVVRFIDLFVFIDTGPASRRGGARRARASVPPSEVCNIYF